VDDVEHRTASRIRLLVRERFGSRAGVKRIEALAGDASTRRYARVWLEGPGTPATAVVMLLADRGVAISSEELAVLEDAPDELPYVNVHRYLASIGVAVPELYADASDAGLLLLEDVGDVALWDAAQGRPEREIERLFELAIDQLLVIQIAGTARLDEGCVAFRQQFDERLFLWEFEHFIEHGLPGGTESPPADDLALLRRHFSAIARFLDRQPRVLNHRDFHAWNLFVHEGRVRVIDFQDALLAPAPYDLATLLGDRVTPSFVHPDLERRLLAYYAAESAARGGRVWSDGDLWEVYSACALQKAFKVVGRFFYLDRVKGKPGYLRYIPPTLRQIARLLASRPELTDLRACLARTFPEIGA
jgi:aminoglycoside/choline kinase family phosphotransferase